jgi:hypothetical protein
LKFQLEVVFSSKFKFFSRENSLTNETISNISNLGEFFEKKLKESIKTTIAHYGIILFDKSFADVHIKVEFLV